MGTHPIFESDFDCLTDDVVCWGVALEGDFGKPSAPSLDK